MTVQEDGSGRVGRTADSNRCSSRVKVMPSRGGSTAFVADTFYDLRRVSGSGDSGWSAKETSCTSLRRMG